MDQRSDIATHGGALLAILSSALGMTTLELFYLVIAIIGAVISLLGYLDKRKNLALGRKLAEESDMANRKIAQDRLAFDRERTKAIITFLKDSPDHDVRQAREVVQKVNEVLKDTELE
ncbi:hypothetical protein ACL2XP_17975 [Sodalis sp. RH21]|uniref:hypothetical protein n=1 Tax=unclassified Sodalis (in: enterobacteria) TaxID=2636512 RepID=UPI0039B43863